MHPSGAHSRRTRCSLGSTRPRASHRNAFGGLETARNGSETHEKRLYSPLIPAADVGQPLMGSCHGVGWGVGCGGRALWSVSRPLSERRGPFFRPPYFGHRFLFIPKHQCFPMFRGTWYLICHLIGKTLWYEVLVTTGTSVCCINDRKRF